MNPSRRFFENAKKFVYRNARPLDFARWKFHFENAEAAAVLEILSAYQNPDGGFGSAVEPDLWNPHSTPAGTLAAAEILREIGFADFEHPVVQGMLSYLTSGKDFEKDRWYFTLPANNAYPHAEWWSCPNGKGVPAENPTAGLAAFALTASKRGSKLYRTARGIAVKSIFNFFAERPRDTHTLRCYLWLLEVCEGISEFKVIDLSLFRNKLYAAIGESVCKEKARWRTEFVCRPSHYFDCTGRIFRILDGQLCKGEAEFMLASQLADGSLPVTWQWWNAYKQAAVAENWWRSAQLITALLYIKSVPER